MLRSQLRLIVVAGTYAIFGFVGYADAQEARFLFAYGPVQNPGLQQIADAARQTRFLESLADALQGVIRLPQNVTLATLECKQVNAFYVPKQKALVICLELIQQIFTTVPKRYQRIATPSEIEQIATGALAFVTLHELGHALIDLYSLPVLGKEEDAADQIASFFVLRTNDSKYAIAGAGWFFSKEALYYSRRHLSDAHSLDPQRRFNVFCWAFGSNPGVYSYLVQGGALPRERAPRCQAEYQQLTRSVTQLLGSYVK